MLAALFKRFYKEEPTGAAPAQEEPTGAAPARDATVIPSSSYVQMYQINRVPRRPSKKIVPELLILKPDCLIINLSTFTESFALFRKDRSKSTLYYFARGDILDSISYHGPLLWSNFFKLRLKSMNFSPEEKRLIYNSPAYQFFKNFFPEFAKNAIDEAMDCYYDSECHGVPMTSIFMEIHIKPDQSQVNITMSDNGRGFPDSFLTKVSTKERQREYLSRVQPSSKNKDEDRPLSFGGAGKAMQNLIAAVLEGAYLNSNRELIPRYEPIEYSDIQFCNGERDGGARISITTSVHPLIKRSVQLFPNEPQLSPAPISSIEPSEVAMPEFMEGGAYGVLRITRGLADHHRCIGDRCICSQPLLKFVESTQSSSMMKL